MLTDTMLSVVAFENEWYLHLVSDSGIQVGFMLPEQPTQPKIFHSSYRGSGVIFSVEVNDADLAYSEAKKRLRCGFRYSL